MSQTLCVNAMHDSVCEIGAFPSDLVRCQDGPEHLLVAGLDEILLGCYAKGILPSEAGAEWATAGRTIDLTRYHHFPGGAQGPQRASPVDG